VNSKLYYQVLNLKVLDIHNEREKIYSIGENMEKEFLNDKKIVIRSLGVSTFLSLVIVWVPLIIIGFGSFFVVNTIKYDTELGRISALLASSFLIILFVSFLGLVYCIWFFTGKLIFENEKICFKSWHIKQTEEKNLSSRYEFVLLEYNCKDITNLKEYIKFFGIAFSDKKLKKTKWGGGGIFMETTYNNIKKSSNERWVARI
jgi:hypothetical protein